MAIFEIETDYIRKIERTTFAAERITERYDLQRLLLRSIEHVSPDTMILAEEFGSFEGSMRRIDLLGLNKRAELVVIELKRTEDGGHIELQAIRYAAMVSAMTFEDAVEAHQKYLKAYDRHSEDARQNIMAFLEGQSEPALSETVRIVLAAADFSIEVTTTVLWLNSNGLDITCVRMRPYQLEPNRVLLDIQQVIPLPEAEEYTIKIRKKEAETRDVLRKPNRDTTLYDAQIGGEVHTRLYRKDLVFYAVKEAIQKGVTPIELRTLLDWRSKSLFFQVPSIVNSEEVVIALEEAGRADSKHYFIANDRLFHIGGETYSLTSKWGDRSIEAVNIIKQRLGDNGSIEFSAIAK